MLTNEQHQEAKNFANNLNDLTDDALIDAWHQSIINHKSAPDGQRDMAYLKKTAAEEAAASRFGLGNHLKKLLGTHPNIDSA